MACPKWSTIKKCKAGSRLRPIAGPEPSHSGDHTMFRRLVSWVGVCAVVVAVAVATTSQANAQGRGGGGGGRGGAPPGGAGGGRGGMPIGGGGRGGLPPSG